MATVALRDEFQISASTLAIANPIDRGVQILDEIFPYLCAHVSALAGKPVRIQFDASINTAETDCVKNLRITPWFFLNDLVRVGFGTGYHEGGHIRFSPYGGKLIAQAKDFGGEVLGHIMNIIIDRKDDMLTAEFAPGFADTLRARMMYIATMTRRKKMAPYLGAYVTALQNPHQLHAKVNARVGKRPGVKTRRRSRDEEITALLRNWKPTDAYEDFFFAAKWHKRPRIRKVHKAMQLLTFKRLKNASEDELLYIAQEVHAILGDPDPQEEESQQLTRKEWNELRKKIESTFIDLITLVLAIELKGDPDAKIDKEFLAAVKQVMKKHLARGRGTSLQSLLSRLASMHGTIHPYPLSTGEAQRPVPVVEIQQHPKYASTYEELRREIAPYVDRLVQKLKNLDNPSEYVLRRRDEGDLDLSEVARIALGLGGYYSETVQERNIDGEIHLGIDNSGSMGGDKLEYAKLIAVLFSEAIRTMNPALVGRVWSYDSDQICDYGPVSENAGFVKLEARGGNADTHFLPVVGNRLIQSPKRRKLLILLCDDGPDNIEKARRLSTELFNRGVIVIHVMIGVHAIPQIYAAEFLFTEFEECLEEFGDILEAIIKVLK